MDPSEEATGSLDDDASSSDCASSVDYISEMSEESTASEAAAAALEDVIDAVERRVDRQRRRAALRRFVRRVLRTTVRSVFFSMLCLAAARYMFPERTFAKLADVTRALPYTTLSQKHAAAAAYFAELLLIRNEQKQHV